jgi:replicative DNA helicase
MSRHDDTLHHVLRLLRMGKNGEPGVGDALGLLREEFVKVVGDDREGGEVEAEAEFDRMVSGAGRLLDDDEDPPDPIPLHTTVVVPPFPVDAFPKRIADMVNAVSEFTQTDPAMPGTSALSVLSSCTGGHAMIEIRPGWREPLNVYTATIAAPGERKSAVQATMVRPVLNAEARLAAAGAAARVDAETRKQIATRFAEQQRHAAARAATGEEAAVADAISAALLADAIDVPAIPRLVADDITPEAAASLLADQGGRLAIISAEGGIFDIIAGRYNKGSTNLDLWLKGHSGDALKVDRKGRPPEFVPRPALTLGLMIQPAVLSAIAGNQQFRGRGFLARILYAYPVSKVGRREIGSPPVKAEIEEAYEATIDNLASGMAGWVGDPAVLTLTKEARQAIQAIEAEVEPTLAGDGELATLADWGGKYVGLIARIAGNLHLAEYGSDGARKSVEASTIQAAKRVGEYFKACAIKAFDEMGTDRRTSEAIYLLARIQSLGKDEVSEREIQRAAKRFHSKAELMPVLNQLVDHGWLIKLDDAVPDVGTPSAGRPQTPRYKVLRDTDWAA